VPEAVEEAFLQEASEYGLDKSSYLALLIEHRDILTDALRGRLIAFKPTIAIRLKLEKIASEKDLDLNGLAQLLLEESAEQYGKQVFTDTSKLENIEFNTQVSGEQVFTSVNGNVNTPVNTPVNTCKQENSPDFRQSVNSQNILSEEEELELIANFKTLLKNVFIAREDLFERYGNTLFKSLSMQTLDRLFFDGLNKDELQLIIEE
jgi:hypothetical protein